MKINKKNKKTKSKDKKDNKYSLNWRFKDFLLEESERGLVSLSDSLPALTEAPQEFEEIKIQGVVYIDGESELMKSQIISHIRAIVGITRVDYIGQSWYKAHYYITRLSIKIDMFKFQHVSLVNVLKFLKVQIAKVPGVKQFHYITKAELVGSGK